MLISKDGKCVNLDQCLYFAKAHDDEIIFVLPNNTVSFIFSYSENGDEINRDMAYLQILYANKKNIPCIDFD